MRRKNSWCLEIIFFFLIIPLSSANSINFQYPGTVNYGNVFTVSLETINFSSGSYDVKIDIMNESSRIAQILNNGEWKSTYYYVYSAINTSVTNSSEFSMNITEKYNGSASINITLKKGSSSFKFGYNLNVSFQNQEQNPKNITNETDAGQDNSSNTQNLPAASGYNYSIIEVPLTLRENFTVKVKITNNEDEQSFELWSYVYSGSICYSFGGREYNKILVTVPGKSSETFNLENQLDMNALDENKTYKLKIKILRQGLKTPKEFTYNLSSEDFAFPGKIENNETNASEIQDESENKETISTTESTGNAIQPDSQLNYKNYESKSIKINNNAVYVFAGLMALLSIYLILKMD